MAIRKGLFSKPAWAAKSPEPVESDQSPSIFEQNVYADILQEQRRRQERKVTKQKEKEELLRKKQSEAQETKAADYDGERAVKKRRISKTPIDLDEAEDGDDDLDKQSSHSDSDSESAKSRKRGARESPGREPQSDTVSSRGAREKSSDLVKEQHDRSPADAGKRPIPVDDDDDALILYEPTPPPPTSKPLQTQMKSNSKPKPPPPPESESDSEEDDYIKDLKRKAREEAKAKNIRATTTNVDTNPDVPTLHSPIHNTPSTSQPPHPTEPPVQIHISTILPNCPPIGIIRRPSQTLESVHKHFCDTHKISDHLRPKIFFAWNYQRLFNSTTTRSILEQIKRKHGIDKSDGKIALEAVTDEIHEHRLQQREKARRRLEEEAEHDGVENGDGDHDRDPQANPEPTLNGPPPSNQQNPSSTNDTNPDPDNPPNKPPGTVLKLTSPTHPLMQLRVHSNTPIDKIVRGYMRRNNIAVGTEVYLVFEGERLDGEQTVEDVGFEDGDCVDVRCK